jgi:hypothetical protein
MPGAAFSGQTMPSIATSGSTAVQWRRGRQARIEYSSATSGNAFTFPNNRESVLSKQRDKTGNRASETVEEVVDRHTDGRCLITQPLLDDGTIENSKLG